MKGRGCETCNNTGYKGRVALYEVMPFTDALKELVLQGASAAEIKTEMIRGGMQTPAHGRHREDPRGHDHARRDPAHHGRTTEMAPAQPPRSCSRRCSTRARRISTSPPARRRTCASTASSSRSRPTPLTPVDTKQLCYSVMTDAQKLRFEEDHELDFSFGVRRAWRASAPTSTCSTACVAGAFRLVPYKIIPLEELGLPPVVDRAVRASRAASCSSPARPARASRRRSRR